MPDRTAVYRLYDAEDQLLYVGAAVDPTVRLKTHSREKSWWNLVARHAIEWHADKPSALKAEGVAIHAEKPLHNHIAPVVGRPDDYAEPVSITRRLPGELHERLRRVAFELRVPMSAIVTEGIERRVAELEAKVREGGRP